MARGSKRRRGKGWELRVYLGHGRQESRSIPNVSAKQADRTLRDFVQEVEARHPDAGTVADLLDRWLAIGRRTWSPSTLAARESWVRRRIQPALGAHPVAELRPEHLDDLYTALLTGGLAARSVRDIHLTIRAALRYAIELGWRTDNPAGRAHPPKATKPAIRPPDTATVAALVALVANQTLGVYVLLAAVTGARRGELVALQWDDWQGDSILIRRSLAQPSRGRPIPKATKTDRERRVAIEPRVMVALAEHRARIASAAETVGTPPGPWMFSEDGLGERPWRPDGASSRFRRLRDKVPGAEDVTLHRLRHFVATDHISSGVDPVTVAAILGHRRPSMTVDVYSSFMPPKGRDAARRITASLLPELPPADTS